jgi:hypothetical protein
MGEVGRKPLAELAPGLLDALDDLVEPETRGDPMTRLRWATKSTRNLADGLGRKATRCRITGEWNTISFAPADAPARF